MQKFLSITQAFLTDRLVWLFIQIDSLALCFFRRVFSDASTAWLKFLGEKEIPVIVCLTFGDHLFFEVEERQKSKSKGPFEMAEEIRRFIGSELYVRSSP